MTPAWRSASTFVVPPGVSDIRLVLGDAGGNDGEDWPVVTVEEDMSSEGIREARLLDDDGGADVPSSANARALPI